MKSPTSAVDAHRHGTSDRRLQRAGRDGALRAALDFGECAPDDPTVDLIAGWWVFDGDSREAFKQASVADAASWQRARGWTLSGAVGALAPYVGSNPAFSELARRAIPNVLGDRRP